MKKVLFLCFVISFVAFTTTTAMAEGVKAGMKEVAFQMQYEDISVDEVDADMSTWVIGGKFGYFFTDMFAVAVSGSLMNIEIEGEDLTMYTIGVEPNLYFNMGNNVVPYVGLNLGSVGFEADGEDESEFYYGGQLGMLVFMNEWAAIDFQGRYITYEIFDTDVDTFGFRVGISVFF